MTVREYIGARYVPLYIGEWDDTKAYEPLSIVTYQGDSYTSRQAVPIGIDITNEEYWVVSAAFNAQVEAYRQEVRNVSDALPLSSFDDTNTIAARFNTDEGRLDTIENTSIPNLQSQITNIRERTFLILGDSYGAGTARKADNTGYETSPNGWIRYMVNTVAAQANTNVYSALDSIVVGNSGFTSSGKYIDVIDDLVDRDVIPDPEAITDLVIFAGTNDTVSTASAVYSAVCEFMIHAKELFPYAQIRVGFMSFTKNNDVEQAYRRGCEEYGGEYVYGLNNLFIRREWLSPDNIHPNFDCYDFVRDYIIDAVFNGNITYKYEYQLNATAPNGYTLVNQLFVIHVTENEVIFESRPAASGGDYPSIAPDTVIADAHTLNLTVSNMPILDYYTTPLFRMERKYVWSIDGDMASICAPCGFGFVGASNPTRLDIGIEALVTNTAHVNYLRYVFPNCCTTLLQNFVS